jgi:hypothetical protein
MIFGYLEDVNTEFFVQYTVPRDGRRESLFTLADTMDRTLLSRRELKTDKPFDWNSAYTVQLSLVPESLVSASLLAKILFAGKALVLMRKSTYFQATPYQYFAGNLPMDDVDERNRLSPDSSDVTEFSTELSSRIEASVVADFGSREFERLVINVHDAVSRRLWAHISVKCRFSGFFRSVRNTYFLGKGEYFQLVVDNLLSLTERPVPDAAMHNRIIKTEVIGEACKLLGVDEEIIGQIFKVVAVDNDINIISFAEQQHEFQLSGSATVHSQSAVSSSVRFSAPAVTTGEESVWCQFIRGYKGLIERPDVKVPAGDRQDKAAIWMTEAKPVNKGFSICANFAFNFSVELVCSGERRYFEYV